MWIRRAVLAIAAALSVATVAAGCSSPGHRPPADPPATSSLPSPAPGPTSGSPPAGAVGCQATGGWDCAWQARFARVRAAIAARPGYLGVELRDRRTGAVWRAGATSHLYWTGSTIKLAMVTSVLERAHAGTITLTATDRQEIADMLAFSSDDAADAIWRTYGRDTMVPRFQTRYGMSNLTFVSGFDRYWGFMKCTPSDLAALVSYVLNKLDATDRAYIVNAMQHTYPIQHWGVWAAGTAQQPGNKNGWSVELDNGAHHWLTSSEGFAGPGQRYALAIMYSMPPGQDSLDRGVHTVSDIAAALFGAATPAPVVVRES